MRLALVAFAAVMAAPELAAADQTHAIASATFTELRTPGAAGKMEPYAAGSGVSLTYLCGCDDMSFGGELSASFLGDKGRRVYDLGLSFVVSFNMKDSLAAPFMAVGFDVVGVEDPRLVDPPSATLGVHGRVGLHGFATKNIYWRAYTGFLGGGPGGITTGVGLGYRFGAGSL